MRGSKSAIYFKSKAASFRISYLLHFYRLKLLLHVFDRQWMCLFTCWSSTSLYWATRPRRIGCGMSFCKAGPVWTDTKSTSKFVVVVLIWFCTKFHLTVLGNKADEDWVCGASFCKAWPVRRDTKSTSGFVVIILIWLCTGLSTVGTLVFSLIKWKKKKMERKKSHFQLTVGFCWYWKFLQFLCFRVDNLMCLFFYLKGICQTFL